MKRSTGATPQDQNNTSAAPNHQSSPYGQQADYAAQNNAWESILSGGTDITGLTLNTELVSKVAERMGLALGEQWKHRIVDQPTSMALPALVWFIEIKGTVVYFPMLLEPYLYEPPHIGKTSHYTPSGQQVDVPTENFTARLFTSRMRSVIEDILSTSIKTKKFAHCGYSVVKTIDDLGDAALDITMARTIARAAELMVQVPSLSIKKLTAANATLDFTMGYPDPAAASTQEGVPQVNNVAGVPCSADLLCAINVARGSQPRGAFNQNSQGTTVLPWLRAAAVVDFRYVMNSPALPSGIVLGYIPVIRITATDGMSHNGMTHESVAQPLIAATMFSTLHGSDQRFTSVFSGQPNKANISEFGWEHNNISAGAHTPGKLDVNLGTVPDPKNPAAPTLTMLAQNYCFQDLQIWINAEEGARDSWFMDALKASENDTAVRNAIVDELDDFFDNQFSPNFPADEPIIVESVPIHFGHYPSPKTNEPISIASITYPAMLRALQNNAADVGSFANSFEPKLHNAVNNFARREVYEKLFNATITGTGYSMMVNPKLLTAMAKTINQSKMPLNIRPTNGPLQDNAGTRPGTPTGYVPLTPGGTSEALAGRPNQNQAQHGQGQPGTGTVYGTRI